MAIPSYARATTSSTLKAISRTLEIESPAKSKDRPKKYKRPSTLTIEDRQAIAYRADLYPIKPLNPRKPCPLAELPSELRTVIYTYVLQARELHGRHPQHHDPLMHICRAIRIEAAYTFFTSTPFTFYIRNLNFSHVQGWIGALPSSHRMLLTKNKHLTIDLTIPLRPMYRYMPPDFIFDKTIEEHWKDCEAFGNLYDVKGDTHRTHFIVFCRLATWWRWSARPIFEGMNWNYRVLEMHYCPEHASKMLTAVSNTQAPCVTKAWTRNTQKGLLVKGALSFFEALESSLSQPFVYESFSAGDVAIVEEMGKALVALKEVFELQLLNAQLRYELGYHESMLDFDL